MIRLGIIGLGEIGEYHTQLTGIPRQTAPDPEPAGILARGKQLAKRLLGRGGPADGNPPRPGIEGSELVAVADLDETRLAWAQQNFELRGAHTDYKALVARTDIDAVLICTPPSLHPEITAEAARHGKHVFCEKPMAITSRQCMEMIEATERAGVILQIGYMLRFSSERERITAAIRNKEIGGPVFFREILNTRAGGPQQWIYDPQLGGGLIWEVSHVIDYVRYVFGEPDTVYALGGNYKPNKLSVVDTYAASLTFPSGDKALLCDSFALKGFGWESSGCRPHRTEIDVLGPGGYIQFPDAKLGKRLTICRYGEPEDQVETVSWRSDWGANGYEAELAHFVSSVRQKKTPAVSGYEGLKTVRLAETILQSIRSGQICKFDALAQEAVLSSKS